MNEKLNAEAQLRNAEALNERIVKIMTLARELNWILPPNRSEPYPNMMISEVEKCMAAMADDTELKRMEKWVAEKNSI